MFPIYKCAFLSKVKEIEQLRGSVLGYAVQAIVKADAEIGQGYLSMETI
jgi:hypothetical protein